VIAYVVTFEARDMLGRIIEEIDSIYLQESNAIARRKLINGDPKTFPGMVADTREFPIRDYAIATPTRGNTRMSRPKKLTPEKVIAIRRRYTAGETMRTLAKEFGISPDSVSNVVNRRSWAHV